MNIEKMQEGAPYDAMVHEALSSKEEKELSWKEAGERYVQLKDSVDEAVQIEYRDHAESSKEQIIATLELERDGYLGEAEVYREKNNTEGEQAMTIAAAFKEVEISLVHRYLEAREQSDYFARLLAQEYPWLQNLPNNNESKESVHV